MSNANESAFPNELMKIKIGSRKWTYPTGITKREYFAAKAMQGLLAAILSSPEMNLVANQARERAGFVGEGQDYVYFANRSLKYADALLAELAKGEK